MKICITGGCGFLGHHLVEHFLKQGSDIVVLDRLSYASSGYDRLRDIGCFDDKKVRVIGCDLSHPIQPGVVKEIGEVDFIIHAAAETHVDNSIVDPLPFLESNVIGTHHLLMLAKELGTRVFLVSTDETYGPAPEGFAGFEPTATCRPTNPYAAAKTGAEALAWAYSNTYRIPITIAVGMNFFGERQHPEKFIVKTIQHVLSGKVLPIHSNAAKTKSGSRFYLHCRNYAAAIDFILKRPDCPPKVHIVGEKEISNLELAEMIAGFVGKKLHYEMTDFHSSRPGHDLRYALVDTFLNKNGWTFPLSIEKSMERTIRWYLNPKNDRWLWWGASHGE